MKYVETGGTLSNLSNVMQCVQMKLRFYMKQDIYTVSKSFSIYLLIIKGKWKLSVEEPIR